MPEEEHFPWWLNRRPVVGTNTTLHLYDDLMQLVQRPLPHTPSLVKVNIWTNKMPA
jgi:hypothetical protein